MGHSHGPVLIYVIMGVSGAGKTTIGELLAARLACPFSDADEFHSAANKDKMARGVPLDDADRLPWLSAMRAAIDAAIARGQPHVFACSALKAQYRRVLADAQRMVGFVMLDVPLEILRARLAGRRGHFFNPILLQSQLDTRETPGADEALHVDATAPPEAVVGRILADLPPLGQDRGTT